MASSESEGGGYEIQNSTDIARAFLRLQEQAVEEGRGEELLEATRTVAERLKSEPMELGEPLYRLPAMRMQVRGVLVRPLYVSFAVCEDRPVVYIKDVKLLLKRKS